MPQPKSSSARSLAGMRSSSSTKSSGYRGRFGERSRCSRLRTAPFGAACLGAPALCFAQSLPGVSRGEPVRMFVAEYTAQGFVYCFLVAARREEDVSYGV